MWVHGLGASLTNQFKPGSAPPAHSVIIKMTRARRYTASVTTLRRRRRTANGNGSPLLNIIVAEIPAYEPFVVQQACKPLHALIKERFENSDAIWGKRTSWPGSSIGYE